MGLFSRSKKSKKSDPSDLEWTDNKLVQQPSLSHENPLFNPNAVDNRPQRTPVLNAFAAEAHKKQRTTGKGKGKERMKDRHVGAKGGGLVQESANKVGSVTYKRNIGQSDTNLGYFKSDGANKVSQEAFGAGIASDPNDMHMSARAVASSRLDKGLGLNVLSHDHFAKHGGEKGVVSAQVRGDAMMTNDYADMSQERASGYLDMLNSGQMTDQEVENFGNKVTRDESGLATGIKEFQGSTFNQNVDLTDYNTLKGLADLQFMDYLTGQVDRHAGNIHVDSASGKVTGIDNDLAFGTNNDGLEESQNFVGLPEFVDRMTANRFLAMSEKDFLKVIGGQKGDYGKLSNDEKAAALERYRTLRDHVEKLSEIDDETGEDKLVDIWDKDILDKATAHVQDENGDIQNLKGFAGKNATNSYIVRAAMDLKT